MSLDEVGEEEEGEGEKAGSLCPSADQRVLLSGSRQQKVT